MFILQMEARKRFICKDQMKQFLNVQVAQVPVPTRNQDANFKPLRIVGTL